MMGEMYANATRVVEWLGLESTLTTDLWYLQTAEVARKVILWKKNDDAYARTKEAIKELGENSYWSRL
jgi:hypothetical protein